MIYINIDSDTLKKNIKEKIALVAPLTVFMATVLFERIVLKDKISIFSINLFSLVGGFFICNTALLGMILYIYEMLNHKCKACKKVWSRIKTDNISVASVIQKISFIQFHIFVKINQVIKTYVCQKCSFIQHKRAKQYSLVTTKNIKS